MHLFFEVQIDVHFNSLSSYTVGFKGMCICFLKFRLTFILTLCLPILPVSKGCASVFLKFRLTFILTLCLPILSVSKGCASVF